MTPGGVTAPAPETLVRVLGPVSATVDGQAVRHLVAAAARAARPAGGGCRAGRVRRPAAHRAVGGLDTTESALSSLQVCVSRLRRALGDTSSGDTAALPPVRVRRRAPGYVLELPEGALDAWRLTRLADAARARVTSDPAAALELLDEGLALVTGEPAGRRGRRARAGGGRRGAAARRPRAACRGDPGGGAARRRSRGGRGHGRGAPARRPAAAREPARPAPAGALPQRSPDRRARRLPGPARPALRRGGGRSRPGAPSPARPAPAAGPGPGLVAATDLDRRRRCPGPGRRSGRDRTRRRNTRCWAGRRRSTSSSRPYAGARTATARSGWCRARPASARPGWRRRWLRGPGRPARRWPSDRRTRPATARRTGRGRRSSAASRASRATARPAS